MAQKQGNYSRRDWRRWISGDRPGFITSSAAPVSNYRKGDGGKWSKRIGGKNRQGSPSRKWK